MTGPGFTLDTAAAATAVKAYDECAHRAGQTLKQMQGDVDALRSSGYEGLQAKALGTAVDGISADVKQLVGLLESLSKVVSNTQTGYVNTDEEIAQSINAVGNIYNRLSG